MTSQQSMIYALLVTVLFAVLAWKTNILRDRGPLSAELEAGKQTFSLARSQLLWWTWAVALVTGYLFIETGSLLPINNETLALLGVSAGTTGAATLIDLPDAPASGSGTALQPSRGWWSDILGDGQGISIHRLQAVLANVGIGLVFIIRSLTSHDPYAFYVIDGNWVWLLGLSSTLYAGVKFKESNVPAPPAAPANANQPAVTPPGNPVAAQ
ncbi:hypothetical protein [Chromobacterium sp. IIBBL 290-4]|uniref:hypothetical protein n=1 Tax=Chromobacterium sp. IIBBL 290-4 TaxID=2953890 RepID=UPI0020B78916|nr:hypothetical protein [Chromobacterium sp. IIBBL 290-4]UTH73545.1 hypothetical protein NKT35_18690 [Chromobacterium sp. IIBBL 290-4]